MLDFLVTSKARRHLLRLLFAELASGSTADLAERARVGYANAHRELHAMALLGVVTSVKVGMADVFTANVEHPLAKALRELAKARSMDALSRFEMTDDDHRVRDELFTLGAPLFGKTVFVSEVEDALVRGVALAHRDATVARVLPLCFYRQTDVFDVDRLRERAREQMEQQAVGLFLDLTAVLSGKQFIDVDSFRDKRRTVQQYFFLSDKRSELAKEAARNNTPDVAAKWGYWMNMGFDGFASMFDKFKGEPRETVWGLCTRQTRYNKG